MPRSGRCRAAGRRRPFASRWSPQPAPGIVGHVVGHVALSPVVIAGTTTAAWYGLGPLCVRPDRQRGGIGPALVGAGLDGIARAGARGCVLLGDPGFYGRFGFAAHPALVLPGVPASFFQAPAFHGSVPQGTVRFHPAFAAGD
ncbi:MAG: N-acetyltransferase [Methylobacterium frigidaeris]